MMNLEQKREEDRQGRIFNVEIQRSEKGSSSKRARYHSALLDADEMNYKVLAERVRYFKEEQRGVRVMSGVLDELREETAIITTMKMCREFGKTEEETKTYIMEKFDLSAENAQEFLDAYPADDQVKRN